MNYRTHSIVNRLVDQAFLRTIVGNPDRRVIENSLEKGEPVPDHLLPGRMIQRLSAADREELKKLKSKDLAGYRATELLYMSQNLKHSVAVKLSI